MKRLKYRIKHNFHRFYPIVVANEFRIRISRSKFKSVNLNEGCTHRVWIQRQKIDVVTRNFDYIALLLWIIWNLLLSFIKSLIIVLLSLQLILYNVLFYSDLFKKNSLNKYFNLFKTHSYDTSEVSEFSFSGSAYQKYIKFTENILKNRKWTFLFQLRIRFGL